MSIQVLNELQHEIERLYIAGSDLAAGDFRLQRLQPKFRALGEKSPVFRKLAEGIERLADAAPGGGEAGSGADSAAALQDLALLLGSVMATQGAYAPEGGTAALSGQEGIGLGTPQSYRRVAEIRDALATTGSGRYEIVRDGFKQGRFQDLRLFPAALQALADPYAELADFAAEHIVPSYGEAAAAALAGSFDASGARAEARKLQALVRIGRTEDEPLLAAAAQEGSDEVRTVALTALSAYPQYTGILLACVKDRKKAIRETVYDALAAGGTAEGAECLYSAFGGKDFEFVAGSLSRHPVPGLIPRLAGDFKSALEHAAESGLTPKSDGVAGIRDRLSAYIRALGDDPAPELFEAYVYFIQHYEDFIALGWIELLDRAAEYMERRDSAQALELLQGLEERNGRFLPNAFRLGAKRLTPKDLYNRYIGSTFARLKAAVTKKAVQNEKQILAALFSTVLGGNGGRYRAIWESDSEALFPRTAVASPEEMARDFDPRWLDWVLGRSDERLICLFARPGHKEAERFLLERAREKVAVSAVRSSMLLIGLERAGVPLEERQELMVQWLEQVKKGDYVYMLDSYLFKQLSKLPAAYAPRLQALTDVFRYESRNQLDTILKEMSR